MTIRHLETGEGTPLVSLHGAGSLRLTRAHELLARTFRVVALETPESAGVSAIAGAIKSLGIDTFNLVADSVGSATALRLTLEEPARVRAVVLDAPTALGPADGDLERQLPSLATPALVLVGTKDAAGPPAIGRRYKELLPNSHLVFVYDAADRISTDRPEAFVEVVVDFLERHEAFVISRAATIIHP